MFLIAGRPPFIDRDTAALDTNRIRAEAVPLAGLVALFARLALIAFVFRFVLPTEKIAT